MVEKKSKEKSYQEALEENNIVPRMATVAAVLKNTIPYFFWCGFYFAEEGEMIVGPYQGTSACPNIEYSGVCGTSARKKETIIVPDVHKFPGHIACDPQSNSEIVVPLIDEGGRVIAVLDVDSSEKNAFDGIDKKFLEEIIKTLLK